MSDQKTKGTSPDYSPGTLSRIVYRSNQDLQKDFKSEENFVGYILAMQSGRARINGKKK